MKKPLLHMMERVLKNKTVQNMLLLVLLLTAPGAHAQVSWLHVDGNQIKDAAGNAVTLRGVSILAPEHNNECTTCNRKPLSEMLSWQADAVKGWNSRVVRLQITTAKVIDPVTSFATNIDPYVQQAIAKGLYVIVDLHLVANYGTGGVPQSYVMNFWNYVAPRYANTPNVIFEVFNEPINPDNWVTWKNYIQPVVTSIRAVAPNNLILVGGPQWSTRVNSAVTNPITGGNIVYVYHLYPNQGGATASNLDAKFGTASQTIPVMLTEFGWNTDSLYTNNVTKGATCTWGVPFRQYLDARPQISWTSYIFDNFWKPQYFDWNWNLMSGENQGQFMQQWLLQTRNLNQPQPAAFSAWPVTSRQINLSWPAVAGADSYTLKRSAVSGGPYTTVATGITATSYADTSLTAQTAYYYVLCAVSAGVEGPASAEVSAVTEGTGIKPDVPTLLTATAGNARVTLNWQVPTGAVTYNLKRATTAGGPYTTVATGLTATSYIDSGLNNGTRYYYVVTAVAGAESAPAAEVSDMPSAQIYSVDNTNAVATGSWPASTASPGYYGINYVTDGNTGSTGGKSLRFTPSLPVAAAYDVWIRWVAGSNRATNTPVDVHHASGTASTSLNQQYNNAVWVSLGTYSFQAGTAGNVVIRNDSANGYVIGDVVKFVLNPADVSATTAVPDSLVATAVSGTQVNLSWKDRCSNETGFEISRAADPGFSTGVTTVTITANSTSYQDTGLQANTLYYYRVRAVNSVASGAYSGADSAQTAGNNTLALFSKNGRANTAIRVYPNPAAGSITVDRLPADTKQLIVYDMKGIRQLVVNPAKQSRVTINISRLPAGMYVLQATGKTNSHLSFIKAGGL
jgi:fibronectin type 3 domain-containing protein